MSSQPVLTAEDKKWRAEDDARTLAQSEVVKSDPERLNAAKEAAKKMAEEDMEKAKAMSHVAGIKGTKKQDSSSVDSFKSDTPDKVKGYNVFKKI